MNEILQQLIDLTEVDRAVVTLREQLDGYPARIAKMDKEESARQKTIEDSDAALEAARHDRRAAEKEIANLREQIRKYAAQQASVKTNKEYQAITHEIETIHQKIDQWETVGLEKLEAEDLAGGRRKEAADQLAALKKDHEAERLRIAEQIKDKRDKLERLTSERERRFAAIEDPDIRDSYRLINERHPGTVAVPLEGGNCGGCHWSLVAQTRLAAQTNKELVRCEHCRRFLYSR